MLRPPYSQWLMASLILYSNCLHAFLLFGYDQGVFGGLITNEDLLVIVNHPSESFLGFIVSSYNLGCLSGCLTNFAIGNRLGRRQALWIAMAFLSAGAVLQTASYCVPQMIVGRIVTGIGVGIDTSTVPTYQAELCKDTIFLRDDIAQGEDSSDGQYGEKKSKDGGPLGSHIERATY